MNAYRKALELGITGTDQQIVAKLKASAVTARPIKLNDLLYTLNMRGMLVKLALLGSGGEKWGGTIMNLIGAVEQLGTESQKLGIAIWFSHITNSRNNEWHTTEPAHAEAFWQLYLSFGDQPTMPTKADFEAIASLGGGWLFSTLTLEQYRADKATFKQEEAEAETQRQTEEASRLNQARKIQMYSALLDAANWLSIQEQCPTHAELIAYLTPNLPSEE